MKVRIVKNPVGLYNLAYEVGEEIILPDLQGRELIETGHAIEVDPYQEVETGESKKAPEKAIRRKRK